MTTITTATTGLRFGRRLADQPDWYVGMCWTVFKPIRGSRLYIKVMLLLIGGDETATKAVSSPVKNRFATPRRARGEASVASGIDVEIPRRENASSCLDFLAAAARTPARLVRLWRTV